MKQTPKIIVGALNLAYRMGYIDRDDEIVRCKDCKHYADDQCDRYADETLGYVHSTQADGFCWVAERREE